MIEAISSFDNAHTAFLQEALDSTRSFRARDPLYEPNPPLSLIIAGGGIYDRNFGWDPRDTFGLGKIPEELRKIGLMPPQTVLVVPVDLRNGYDIHNADLGLKGDTFVSLMMINPDAARKRGVNIRDGFLRHGDGYRVSDHHTPASLAETLPRLGARVGITISNADENESIEVRGKDLLSPGYMLKHSSVLRYNDPDDRERSGYLRVEIILREDVMKDMNLHRTEAGQRRHQEWLASHSQAVLRPQF